MKQDSEAEYKLTNIDSQQKGNQNRKVRLPGTGLFLNEKNCAALQCLNFFLQLALLVHLQHDIAAAYEFALYVQLGDSRPV
jgi:hypothetical protein